MACHLSSSVLKEGETGLIRAVADIVLFSSNRRKATLDAACLPETPYLAFNLDDPSETAKVILGPGWIGPIHWTSLTIGVITIPCEPPRTKRMLQCSCLPLPWAGS